MRFWPFGKREEDVTDVGSRVVTATTADGASLRAKLAIHLREATARESADLLFDRAAQALTQALERVEDAAALIDAPSTLAGEVTQTLSAPEVRSLEIVTLFALGGLPDGARSRRPSSRPPPRGPLPSRRVTSSQMLAVRDSRLIPEGAPAALVGASLVPLMRDASTRLLVAALRAYDLCVVRELDVDPDAPEDFSELVPQSTAAPGRFAMDRADEVARWEETLGEDVVAKLSYEATAVTCYFLHYNLGGSGLETNLATAVLESAAEAAFKEDPPLGGMGAYLSGSPGDAKHTFASALARLTAAGEAAAPKLAALLGATVVSLQSDFAFVAQQVYLSGVKPGT